MTQRDFRREEMHTMSRHRTVLLIAHPEPKGIKSWQREVSRCLLASALLLTHGKGELT